ncbi:hypothetical protein C8J56DRAFT_1091425 [Mycena floridula]|nr:hypothetical protein C8J56DRAFT_1091425 [Mycena floridula]
MNTVLSPCLSCRSLLSYHSIVQLGQTPGSHCLPKSNHHLHNMSGPPPNQLQLTDDAGQTKAERHSANNKRIRKCLMRLRRVSRLKLPKHSCRSGHRGKCIPFTGTAAGVDGPEHARFPDLGGAFQNCIGNTECNRFIDRIPLHTLRNDEELLELLQKRRDIQLAPRLQRGRQNQKRRCSASAVAEYESELSQNPSRTSDQRGVYPPRSTPHIARQRAPAVVASSPPPRVRHRSESPPFRRQIAASSPVRGLPNIQPPRARHALSGRAPIRRRSESGPAVHRPVASSPVRDHSRDSDSEVELIRPCTIGIHLCVNDSVHVVEIELTSNRGTFLVLNDHKLKLGRLGVETGMVMSYMDHQVGEFVRLRWNQEISIEEGIHIFLNARD